MTAENREENELREAAEDTLADILSSVPEEDEEKQDEYWDEDGWDEEASPRKPKPHSEKPSGHREPERTEEKKPARPVTKADSGKNKTDSTSENDTDKLVKELKREEKSMKSAQWFLIYLGIFLVVIWILFFKIIGITHMPSEAMEPRIDAGDLVVFYRLDKDAEFQDVIVFEKDIEGDGTKTMLVGRVMAGPGDTVEISDSNRLIVNGNVIIESTSYRSDIAKRGDRVAYPLTLAEDEYFVIADNRLQGVDSRYFGPVKKKDVLGTIITLIRRNKM